MRTRILMELIIYYLVLLVNPMGRILVRRKSLRNDLEMLRPVQPCAPGACPRHTRLAPIHSRVGQESHCTAVQHVGRVFCWESDYTATIAVYSFSLPHGVSLYSASSPCYGTGAHMYWVCVCVFNAFFPFSLSLSLFLAVSLPLSLSPLWHLCAYVCVCVCVCLMHLYHSLSRSLFLLWQMRKYVCVGVCCFFLFLSIYVSLCLSFLLSRISLSLSLSLSLSILPSSFPVSLSFFLSVSSLFLSLPLSLPLSRFLFLFLCLYLHARVRQSLCAHAYYKQCRVESLILQSGFLILPLFENWINKTDIFLYAYIMVLHTSSLPLWPHPLHIHRTCQWASTQVCLVFDCFNLVVPSVTVWNVL